MSGHDRRQPILVLAHVGDQTAAAAVALLRRRLGSAMVLVVTPEELLLAPRWSHTIDDRGVRTRIELANGTVIGERLPHAVLDRLRFVRPPQFHRATPEDRGYATMELHALLLSWLASLTCLVVNRPSPRGLGGAERGGLEWLRLALAAGLPVRRTAATTNARDLGVAGWPHEPGAGHTLADGSALPSPVHGPHAAYAVPRGRRPATFRELVGPERRRMLVVGERVLGAPVAGFVEPARRLAAGADCALLGLELARRAPSARDPELPAGEWCVCSVTPQPALHDAPGLGALTDLLVGSAPGGTGGGMP